MTLTECSHDYYYISVTFYKSLSSIVTIIIMLNLIVVFYPFTAYGMI